MDSQEAVASIYDEDTPNHGTTSDRLRRDGGVEEGQRRGVQHDSASFPADIFEAASIPSTQATIA